MAEAGGVVAVRARSRSRDLARRLYVYGVWLLLASIIVQFFLAGIGLLDDPSFLYWHANVNGAVVGLLPLALIAVGWYGRVSAPTLWLTAAVFGLVVLQSLLIAPYRAAATGWLRAVAGLHVVNALFIFWVGLRLIEKSRGSRFGRLLTAIEVRHSEPSTMEAMGGARHG